MFCPCIKGHNPSKSRKEERVIYLRKGEVEKNKSLVLEMLILTL